MGIEIERKFLIIDDGWRAAANNGRHIRQAYLASSSVSTVRIRITDETRARLTIKSGFRGFERDEFEYDVPLKDAQAMLELRQSGIIEKVRYEVMHTCMRWEVDVFEGENAGLTLAEIELDDADTELSLPSWVGSEVSGDARFQNSALAAVPFATWRTGVK